ncbi:hypothetical protein [Vibrio phage pTD1]|uniref:Uncharacterized protein n=1 Tax=Vibrio phage pTD1 TaxID=1938577 RepID=A0A1Q2U322_9CAUD|nr:hypothetical protein FDH33_gp139 [Vibrio phage pTD1]BAW98348.1 hypothetical protein [Vibrio phage pTD1]
MTKTLSLVGICLSDFSNALPPGAESETSIGLIQEALIELGYHVSHVQHVQGTPSDLAPVRAHIRTAIADQANGIPTEVNVGIKPANQHCFSVKFFK